MGCHRLAVIDLPTAAHSCGTVIHWPPGKPGPVRAAGHTGERRQCRPRILQPYCHRRHRHRRPARPADAQGRASCRQSRPAAACQGEDYHLVGSVVWTEGRPLPSRRRQQDQFPVRHRLSFVQGPARAQAPRPSSKVAHHQER